MVRRNRALVAAALAGGFLLAGCGGTAVSQESVEEQISEQLEEQVGVAPAAVDCPGDLPAEEESTMRCTLTADDGSQIGVTVTVVEVDGSDVNYTIEVDDEVMS